MNFGGSNSIIWIIVLLLLFSGNCNMGCGNNGCCGNDNSFIWIIILLLLFNNGSCGICENK